MPPPDFWDVTPHGLNNYRINRNITWGDIKECVSALTNNGDEVFAGLHRYEGGFMCVSGPGFETNEIVDSALPNQPTRPSGTPEVRKAIRFDGICGSDWPSWEHSFLKNKSLKDSDVVISMDRNPTFSFRFEGQNCTPWTKVECRNHANILVATLPIFPINANLAAKIQIQKARKRKLGK